MATLAPRKGVFVSRYFARRQTVRWVVLKLAPGTSQPPGAGRACARTGGQGGARFASKARQQPPQAQRRPEREISRALNLVSVLYPCGTCSRSISGPSLAHSCLIVTSSSSRLTSSILPLMSPARRTADNWACL